MRLAQFERTLSRVYVLVLLFAIGTACTKKNPAYCETSEDCEDPSAPFCDVDGTLEGTANRCIPDPNLLSDAGVTDAAVPDAAPRPDAAPASVEALRQTSTAAGRLSGGTYTLDAQVGRALGPVETTGDGGKTLRAASPVE